MAGDTISTYYGEFLVSPIPLELSFNWCSHNCHYCFANLNKPERQADIKATMRLLADYHNRDSLEAKLLQCGYPVLVSNRVDPFAASNYQQAVPILELMSEMGIPVALQTKGGKGIDEVLEFLPSSCWYISIATLREDLRQQIEPGAPSIASRFELIEQLTAAGHSVSVGLNPWVEEWCSLAEAEKLLEMAKASGAHGAWTETLHFNHKQLKNLSERGKQAIAPEIIQRACKRNADPEEFSKWIQLREMAIAAGLEVFSVGQPNRSDYFAPYRERYPQTFSTLQDFVNLCHDAELGPGDLISFSDFADALEGSLPSGELCIGHYVGATAHNVCRDFERWTNWMSYRDLLKMAWGEGRIKFSPVRSAAFAYAVNRVGDEYEQIFDEEGLPYLAFSPEGFDTYYAEVE